MGKLAYPAAYRGTGADLRMVGPSGPVRTYRLSPEELAELEARLPRRPPEKRRWIVGQGGRRHAQEVGEVSEARIVAEPQVQAEATAEAAEQGRQAGGSPELTEESLAQVVREHPTWTYRDLARHFGVSSAQFYRLLKHNGVSLTAIRRDLSLPGLIGRTGRTRGIATATQERRQAATAAYDSTERYEMQGRFELSRLAARLKVLESVFGSAAVAIVRIEITAGREVVSEEAGLT